MNEFLITLGLTLILFIGAALIFNFCRRRISRSRHPLTATCHQDGGTMCCSCSSTVQTIISRR